MLLPALRSQQTAVPVAKEPHHHQIFENSYVRAFRVSIPANDKTLLHRHDLPYVYVSLGPADIINAPVDQPEIHPKLVDGQVGYSKPIVHAATAVGMPFNNVTIELLRPQGEAENLCAHVVPGTPHDLCIRTSISDHGRSYTTERQMKTDATEVDLITLPDAQSSARLQPESLLVGLDEPGIEVRGGDGATRVLRQGEVFWNGPDQRAEIANPNQKMARCLQLTFAKEGSKRKA